MVDAAVELFFERGYDATKMEDVAERADVGASTLYRYFDSKEALALAPLGEPGVMGAELRRRPPEETLGVAIGHAVVEMLRLPRSDAVLDERFREIVFGSPRPQSRLLDWYREEERLLREAIADREHSSPDDVDVVFAARAATLVLEIASNESPAAAGPEALAARARAIMRDLAGRAITLPQTDT